MVIKVKEITIGRSRKWAWDFGNAVGYTISVTVEGTTAKDTVDEMRRNAMNELLILLDTEQERCRNVYDIAHIQEDIKFNEAVENAQESTASGHPVEKLVVKEGELIVTEEVLMDLKGVTIMVITEKALLVTKEGSQKWVPLSQIDQSQKFEEGDYIDLVLTDKGEGWIHKKGWDKLEVRKR